MRTGRHSKREYNNSMWRAAYMGSLSIHYEYISAKTIADAGDYARKEAKANGVELIGLDACSLPKVLNDNESVTHL